jgi:radical SAM superfamily enzyme YgiQ (UPF0313 family)
MLDSPRSKLESRIKDLDSKVFAIDLHWDVHSHGALKTAEICREQHPNSFILLGGLTASCFSREIVTSFDFVDGVVRGEAEDAVNTLSDRVIKGRGLRDVPNLTYREPNGRVMINPHAKPSMSIDDYSFTNLNLIEPKERLLKVDLGPERVKVWNLPVCRGCTFNCVTCGGSDYAYRKIFLTEKPAFRSPSRIADDFHRLDEQGISRIFLFQDCRIGTRSYYESLLKTLHRSRFPK